eukprot:927628-Amphidinium_carterae.1
MSTSSMMMKLSKKMMTTMMLLMMSCLASFVNSCVYLPGRCTCSRQSHGGTLQEETRIVCNGHRCGLATYANREGIK